MAQQGVQLDRDIISCSICLDFLKDPVTVPCGHSYCKDCINGFWDEEDQKKLYSCPQCREVTAPRPTLKKSTMLAVLVEELKKTGLQAAPADLCYAGPEDVACDYCTGRKLKAFKSCLVCLVSYCEKHLQPHHESPAFKKHKLVDPSKKLQENICSQHDEVMKMFCRKDQKLMCYLCSVDDHRGHNTVSAAAERSARQKKLEESQQIIQQGIQDRETDLKVLEPELAAINGSADDAVKDSEKTFTVLIHLIQKRSSEVKQKIRSQQETEVSRVKELQKKLEKEISELKKKEAELKQLSDTEDHNEFLRNYSSLSSLDGLTHSSSLNIRPLRYFQDVPEALSEVSDKVQDVLNETLTDISLKVTEVNVLLAQPEPKTRDGMLKYSKKITLNPNTANNTTVSYDGINRKATFKPHNSYHYCTENKYQVLSAESLTGRCYWEVEWKGMEVYVAATYDSRAGGFGKNDTSWALHYDNNYCYFWHKNNQTRISGPKSSRIGVYLDHGAGVLSFYSVSEANNTMTLLHTVWTAFTKPLNAEFLIRQNYDGNSEFIQLK